MGIPLQFVHPYKSEITNTPLYHVYGSLIEIRGLVDLKLSCSSYDLRVSVVSINVFHPQDWL